MNEKNIEALIAQNEKLQAQNEALLAELKKMRNLEMESILDGGTILADEPIKESKEDGKIKEAVNNEKSQIDQVAAGARTITGDVPLIIFVGPADCGKSMVLMSLVEYLRSTHSAYEIEANRRYIPGNEKYEKNCYVFDKILRDNTYTNLKEPLPSTVNEVLVDIKLKSTGERKYRMLEAPGEDFFSKSTPDQPYAHYLKNIISKTRTEKYPIYFVMLLDLHTDNDKLLNDAGLRGLYENRLIEIFKDGYNRDRGDKVILLYNKFDLRDKGFTVASSINQLLDNYYSGIKNEFKYKMVVDFKAYNSPLPYISGKYSKVKNQNGKEQEIYRTDREVTDCANGLWNELT